MACSPTISTCKSWKIRVGCEDFPPIARLSARMWKIWPGAPDFLRIASCQPALTAPAWRRNRQRAGNPADCHPLVAKSPRARHKRRNNGSDSGSRETRIQRIPLRHNCHALTQLVLTLLEGRTRIEGRRDDLAHLDEVLELQAT